MNNRLITGAKCGLAPGFVKHDLNFGDRFRATRRNEAGSLSKLNSSACISAKWAATEPLADAEQVKLPDTIHLLINTTLAILHFNKSPK